MRRQTTPYVRLTLLLVVAAFGVSPAMAIEGTEATLEEVLERYRAALGGDAWNAVQNLRLAGTYTAFSEPGAFTLDRGRAGLSRFDYQGSQFPMTTGYDGEASWWINPAFGYQHAIPTPVADASIAALEAPFPSTLLGAGSAGIELVLDGVMDFEGEETYKITAKLPGAEEGSDLEETWYLSTETALPVARIHPASDFGQQMPGSTYFMDYRAVDGLTLAHRVETEFGTRHRVMEVESVTLNPALSPQHFAMPVPSGMEPLMATVGHWQVKVERFGRPGAPPQESTGTASIEAHLHGGLLVETINFEAGGMPIQALATRSYDAGRERYQETVIDNFGVHQDLLRGTFEEGALTVTNLETDSAEEAQGQPSFVRRKLHNLSPEGFQLDIEQSTDGEEWTLRGRYSYSRPTGDAGQG